MTRAVLVGGVCLVAATALFGCQLPSSKEVLYRCEADGSCAQRDFACQADGYCHPSGVGGGASGGSAGGGGGTGGGSSGGAGGGTGGGGVCIPLSNCPVQARCGSVDAGCGVLLDCGTCVAPEECGRITPNACALPKLCSQGFCWENPLPQGNSLNAVFAFSARAAWFAGDRGTLLFWNGERTELAATDVSERLLHVHGAAADEVYAVGEGGTVLRFNGVRWTKEATPGTYRLNSVWAAPGGFAFAGANGGYLLGRDPNTGVWSEMAIAGGSFTADIESLTGLATGEVFATSSERAFRLPSLSATTWQPDVLWSTLNRSPKALASTETQVFALCSVAGPPQEVVLTRVDGGWRPFGMTLQKGVENLAAWRNDEVWVSGPGGVLRMLRVDGGAELFALSRDGGLPGVWATSDGVFFSGASGTQGLVARDGGVRELSKGSLTNLNAVCGQHEARLFAPGDEKLVFERRPSPGGARWEAVLREAGTTNRWQGCFAQGTDKVWVMGDQRHVLRQTGGLFVAQEFGAAGVRGWLGAWGSDNGPWYFVGGTRSVQVSPTGNAPLSLASPTPEDPAAVFGITDNDVIVVGSNSLLFHRTASWGAVAPPQGQVGRQLTAVHAQRLVGEPDGGSVVSVVGLGTAWRRVAGSWVVDSIAPGTALRATWVSPEGAVWAAGDDGRDAGVGQVFVWADGGWLLQPVPSVRPFRGITGLASADQPGPYVVGQGGVILRRQNPDGG